MHSTEFLPDSLRRLTGSQAESCCLLVWCRSSGGKIEANIIISGSGKLRIISAKLACSAIGRYLGSRTHAILTQIIAVWQDTGAVIERHIENEAKTTWTGGKECEHLTQSIHSVKHFLHERTINPAWRRFPAKCARLVSSAGLSSRNIHHQVD